MRWFLVVLGVMYAQAAAGAETIISKSDADYIFSLNRAGWEAYAKRMIHPDGWKVQLAHHDTGTGVMAFDPKSGMGMSIQPLYRDDVSPPEILIVGSFYPTGTLPPFTPEYKAQLESAAQKDLGGAYSVSASRTNFSTWEGIELMVTRSTHD